LARQQITIIKTKYIHKCKTKHYSALLDLLERLFLLAVLGEEEQGAQLQTLLRGTLVVAAQEVGRLLQTRAVGCKVDRGRNTTPLF